MLSDLLANNRSWAVGKQKADPDYFRRLSSQQTPDYLWIGCSDSRVPANEIVGLDPGELFVHRNVANLAVPTDINFLSVLAFAVNVLHIRHIIVCGHYGCGGVHAAMDGLRHGVIDHWLQPIRDTADFYDQELSQMDDDSAKHNRLCELSVHEQVNSLARTPIIQSAWNRGKELRIHGWVYGLEDGLIRCIKNGCGT